MRTGLASKILNKLGIQINPATKENQETTNSLISGAENVYVLLQQIRDAIRMPIDYTESSNSRNINGTVIIGSGTLSNITNIGGYSADQISENNSYTSWSNSIRRLVI